MENRVHAEAISTQVLLTDLAETGWWFLAAIEKNVFEVYR
jgi:hypothetical protein